MRSVLGFFQSEMGRRVGAWMLGALSLAAKGGLLPLDYAIPGFGLTTGEILMYLGLGVATTAGSASRK